MEVKQSMTVEELICILFECYGENFNWHFIPFTEKFFVNQAKKEIKPGHPLFGRNMVSVYKCTSNDDVLFVTEGKSGDLYIIIHLTYNDNNDVRYPRYNILGSLKEAEKYLRADYELNYM